VHCAMFDHLGEARLELDFCWISRRVEHVFACLETSKSYVDLRFCLVGGDGFEPPTLRCKGGSHEFDYQRKRVPSQFRATFSVISLRLS
jgi:hypothetical protein